MSNYRRYPKYRDSGVEWIGEVPAGWEVRPLCRTVSCNDDSLPDSVSKSSLIRYVDISSVTHTEGIKDAQQILLKDAPSRARRKARAGDVVISTVRTYLKAVAPVTDEFAGCVYSTGFAILRPRPQQVTSQFLKWMMLNELLIQTVEAHSEGLSYPAINAADLVKLKTMLPPSAEQTAIASYLDRATARIDALIAKKTRFIELLKEKRQALITHAVTKGLDPKAKMKDSGVEWIGEVPEHWRIVAIKHLTPVKRGASPRPIDDPKYFSNDGEFGWTRIEDVSSSDGVLRETRQRLSPLGASLSVQLTSGALFLSIAASVGKPCIAGTKICIHDGFVYFPRLSLDPWWLFRVFECGAPFVGLGKMGTQLNLNTETVAAIHVPVPPDREISALLKTISDQISRIDRLVNLATRSITFLQEKRSALITAAVTGQIDVRDDVRDDVRGDVREELAA